MADGITRIAVEGFKSIVNRQEIEIAPLTILAGANSSGKSSIMQPLLMLKQTLEAQYDPGPLLLDGANVRFTSSDQFLSRTEDRTSGKLLTIEIATTGCEYALVFGKAEKRDIEVIEQRYTLGVDGGEVITLRPEMTPNEVQKALSSTNFKNETTGRVVRKRFLLDIDTARFGHLNEIKRFPITDSMQNVIHVPGLRGSRDRSQNRAGTGPLFPGAFDTYAASIIDQWQSDEPSKLAELNQDLQHVLGVVEKVEAYRLNETQIEVRVNRLTSCDDMVSLSDVGFGVSQVLPVLVALRAADQRNLVYIEEPEIHLHPRAQVKLGDILARAAQDGARVIAETHSTLLLTAIQTLVAKGELASNLVKFHWFERDPKAGVTRVSSTGLDSNGTFTESDWPEDFDDIILNAEGAYLDAVEGRQVR